MAGFSLATPPLECSPLPERETLYHSQDHPLFQEMKMRTNYNTDCGITATFSSFDSLVGVFDSLLHV